MDSELLRGAEELGNAGAPFTAAFGLCLCQPRAEGKEDNMRGLQRWDRIQTLYLTKSEKQACMELAPVVLGRCSEQAPSLLMEKICWVIS